MRKGQVYGGDATGRGRCPTVVDVYPRSLPGRVHPAARAAVDARWAQVNAWLWAATAVRVLAMLAAIVAVAATYATDAGWLVLLTTLVVVQVGTVWLFEHDPDDQRTPSRWTTTSLGTGLLAGISTGLAIIPAVRGLPLGVADLIVLVVGTVPAAAVVICTIQAARRVTTPGLPELGGTELRLRFTIRKPGAGWGTNNDVAVLDAEELVLHAYGGHAGTPNTSSTTRVPLRGVQAVSVRAAGTDEPPWAQLVRGWTAPPSPGPVVQLDWAPPGGALVANVAPVDRADDLAAALGYRVWALTGRAPEQHPLARPAAAAPERGPAPPQTATPTGESAAPLVAVLPGAAIPAMSPPPPTPTGVPPSSTSPAVAWAAGALGVVGLPLLVALLAVGSPRPFTVGVVGVLAAGTGWVLARSRPRLWPAWAVSSGVLVVVATLGEVPFGVILVAAGVALAWWGGRQLSALTPAQATTTMVLTLPLAGGGSLQVHGDRLVLAPDAPNRGGGNLRQDLHLNELVLLQPGTRSDQRPAWWPLPGDRGLTVPPGPALRVVGGGQQWLITCPDPSLLARVIGGRAREPGPGRVSLAPQEWADGQQKARRLASGTHSGVNGARTSVLQNSAWRWIRLGAPWTVVWLGFSALLAAHAGPEDLGGTAFMLLMAMPGIAAVAWGATIERRLRPAEDHPLPPGAPPWGEQRPNHPPIAGWQPWAASQQLKG